MRLEPDLFAGGDGMSPEEQRIAIANACGYVNILRHTEDQWHFLTTKDLLRMNGATIAGRNCVKHPDGLHHPLPDFLNDLNAMHEAEKILFAMNDWRLIREYFSHVSPNLHADESCDSDDWLLCHANASQRAEAFLRTLGLWKD